MFVRIVQKKNDRVSVRIVENHRENGKVKQKTVCGIGTAHKDDTKKLEQLRRVAEEMIPTIRNSIQPVLPGFDKNVVYAPKRKKGEGVQNPSYDNLVEEERLKLGVDDVFSHEYKQMGLFETLEKGYKKEEKNDLLKEVVMARISDPGSKRKSVEKIERDRGKKFDLDSVYRMMDRLAEREDWVKERVGKRTLGLFKEKIHVAFFDVTTLYFESFAPDELRASGYSKDNKVKETQVVLALMTTTEGLPLGYELFPGNTYEGATLVSAVDELCKRYDVIDTTIVADRAMFTKNNLKELDERKMDFVVSAKLKGMGKEMTEKILADVDVVREKQPEDWHGEYEYEGRRLVVGWSPKRAAKDRKERERLLERVRGKLKGGKVRVKDLVKNTGTKKYLKFENKSKEMAVLDEEKIGREERWDGIYGVSTSHDKSKMDGAEIFGRYRGLWQVEEAFRINKHDLKMRPIYHWTGKRIRAHILICYMAYAVSAIVRHKLKKAGVRMSVGRMKEELGYRQESVVRDKGTGKRFLLPSKVTPEQRAIYEALGIEIQEKVRLLN